MSEISPIKVTNLCKTYQTRQRKGLFKSQKSAVDALQNVSLEVQAGEIFGLLGPNGAGKTTLIKILTTLLLPTSGDAWVNGFHVQRQENQVRASVGCMLMGERGLYWKLTGRENLEYFGALYHLNPSRRKQRANEIISLLSMNDLADRTVETYSSGQKMKLAFGKALINDAPLLVLDEPTNTLDVPSASELRAIVRSLNDQGKTVVYTTHIMNEAETLCDRVAIIDRGQLLALGTVSELKASLRQDQVTHFEGVISAKAENALRQLPEVLQTTRSTQDGKALLIVVTAADQGSLPRLIDILTAQGAVLQKITSQEPTLEDVFIAKTGRSLAQDTAVKQP
jgi:ABC-2 type transport system ATP-binding protein